MLTNKITLILIIILLLIFFIRQNKSHEQFTSNALVEWNKSATEYLCDNELDETGTKASFIKFCDRVVSDDDYKNFSYMIVDKPGDYVTKKIHGNNIKYGEKFSTEWNEFPNKDIIGNDIGDYKLNSTSCKKFANTKEDALGFSITKNNQCYLKSSMKMTPKSGVTSYTKASTAQFTYSFWLKINSMSSSWRNIFRAGGNNVHHRSPFMAIMPNTTGIHIRVSTSKYWNDGRDIPAGNIPFKKWVHVACSINDRRIRTYVNSKLINENTLGAPARTSSFYKDFNLHLTKSQGVDIAKLRIFPLELSEKFIRHILIEEHPEDKLIDPDKNPNGRYIQMPHNWGWSGWPVKYFRRPSYRLVNGIVHLSGLTNTTSKGIIGHLPIEARPSHQLIMQGGNWGGSQSRIYIRPDGKIYAHGGLKWHNTFDGMSYPVSTGNTLQYEVPYLCHYVQLTNNSDYLAVREVQVYDNNNKLISKGAKVYQTSTENESWSAQNAVDGNKETLAHTKKGTKNKPVKLIISFGTGVIVSKVVIYNRTTYTKRIKGTRVSLLDKKKKEFMHKIWDDQGSSIKSIDKITQTVSGRKCQNWRTEYPHKHPYILQSNSSINMSKVLQDNSDIAGIEGYHIKKEGRTIIPYYAFIKANGDKVWENGTKPWGSAHTSFTANLSFDGPIHKILFNDKASGLKSYEYVKGPASNIGGITSIHSEKGKVINLNIGLKENSIASVKNPEVSNELIQSSGIGNHNYCRNPDKNNGLWCFTTDANKRWEYCNGPNGYVAGSIDPRSYTKTDTFYPSSREFIFNMSPSKTSSGFKHYGGNHRPGSYTIKDGMVYLSGFVIMKTRIPYGAIIDVLPKECRPLTRKIFTVNGSWYRGRTSRIDITPEGEIICVKGGHAQYISLDGISYPINSGIEMTLAWNGHYKPLTISGSQSSSDGLVKEIELYNSSKTKPYSINIDETTGNQTISAVIRPLKGGRQNIFDKGFAGEGSLVIEPTGHLSYYYGISGGHGSKYGGCNTGKPVIKWGELQHIAIVRDFTKKQMRWYINGALVHTCGTFSTYAKKTPWPAKIGTGYTNNFQGSFFNLKIHNKAMSDIEIQSLFSESKGKTISYGAPSLQISKTGLVSLSGVLGYKKKKTSNKWGLVSEIPEEYRPNRELLFVSEQNGKLHEFRITPTGHIYSSNDVSINSYISLDGISFYKNK